MITAGRIGRMLAVAMVLLGLGAPGALAQCIPDPNGPGYACPLIAPFPQVIGVCPISTLTFLDQTTLSCVVPGVACPLAPVHDVARGDLECLRLGCALARSCDSPLAARECADPFDTMAVDMAEPALEEGYWYLVRVTGGTWDSPAPQQEDYDPVPPDITGCP